MREIIIITVSIVFVIIMYPIVFPDRSVILYVRDLSEKNAGQKYRYQILFKLRSGNDIELILYSDQLYKCMSAVFFARYIENIENITDLGIRIKYTRFQRKKSKQ